MKLVFRAFRSVAAPSGALPPDVIGENGLLTRLTKAVLERALSASASISSAAGQYVIDDVTFSPNSPTTALPEPHAIALLAAILTVLFIVRKVWRCPAG